MKLFCFFLIFLFSCQSYHYKQANPKVYLIEFDGRHFPARQIKFIKSSFRSEVLRQYGVAPVIQKTLAKKLVKIKLLGNFNQAVGFVSQDDKQGEQTDIDRAYRSFLHQKRLNMEVFIYNKKGELLKQKIYTSRSIFSEWEDANQNKMQALKQATYRLVKKIVADL